MSQLQGPHGRPGIATTVVIVVVVVVSHHKVCLTEDVPYVCDVVRVFFCFLWVFLFDVQGCLGI